MSLRDVRRHAGQIFMVGFGGHSVPPEVAALAREFDLGGAILFARNVSGAEQVSEMAFDLRSLGQEQPLWVGVDQEGGRVARLRTDFTRWPPMATLGRAGHGRDLAKRFATALAGELAAVGITIDFAPVLDVATNAANPVIGDRALSDRADVVADLGRLIIEALQSAGIAACGKHFPGHGDTSVDSHHELPLVEHPLERLREVELQPFRAAIEAGVASIMVGHLLVPALDEVNPGPLSRAIVTEWLRHELGFEGLIATDDMEMKAISGHRPADEAAVDAVAAGCDMVLICGTDHDVQARAVEGLIRAVESERVPASRVEDAIARQRRAKERFLAALPPRPLTGLALRDRLARAEAIAVAEEMAAWG
jgi:beta-N-acetylhexosaminidase